ncbi:MAG: protein BatD [Candidatus Marinimicrobia bacterium]|nr:protein BatD [Candidatus Neomarinimicrobiota bacterium]
MKFRFLLSLFLFSSYLIGDIKVYSTVDDNHITINEAINFKVIAEGSKGFPQLDISQVADFSVISGPSQNSSFQWINGEMSSSKILSWTLIPKKVGNLRIPKMSVRVDGKKYTLSPIKITVIKSPVYSQKGKKKQGRQNKETGPPEIFLKAESDKTEAFQGEQITVYYKLYTRVKLRQYSVEKKPQGVGFWQEELYAPKQPILRDTRVEGVQYRVATLYKMAIFPTTNGDLLLNPMVLNCTVEIPGKSRFSPFFDDFFSDSFFGRTKSLVVQSQSLELKVHPIPDVGKPLNYTGAVGRFTLDSYVDTSVVEANQAITFTVELKGTGNIKLFDMSPPEFPQTLEIFNPKAFFKKDEFRDDITGVKRWEYIIIPRKAGRYFIPQQELTYFNPQSEEWESSSTEVISLTILPSKHISDQPTGLTKEEIALLEQDIRYIHTKPMRLKPVERRLISLTFIWANMLGLLLFASPKLVEAFRTNLNGDSGISRAKRALRKANRQLKKVTNHSDFETISRQIYEYFGNKLNIPSVGLDSQQVQSILSEQISSDLVNEIVKIIEQCEQGQFTPESQEINAMELARTASLVLSKIDRKL